MSQDPFLRERRLQYEKDQKREKINTFIYNCLDGQTDAQKEEEKRTEMALMAVNDRRVVPRISSEAAQRLYSVRLAATSLYDRYDAGEDLSKEDISLLLALGHELMEIEGKKGMIPAMQVLKKIKGEVPHALANPTGTIFVFPIKEYLISGEVDEDTIFDILTFAHRAYRWTTNYLRKHKDVGAPLTTKYMLSKSDRVREKERERQKRLRGPEANHILEWAGIAFRLYDELCMSQALEQLPIDKQGAAINGILKELRHDIFYSEYYNPDFFEPLPRQQGIKRTFETLILAYVLNQNIAPSIRQAVHDEIFDIITDDDFPFKRRPLDEMEAMGNLHKAEDIDALKKKIQAEKPGMDEELLDFMRGYQPA